VNECASSILNRCEQTCVNTITSFRCECRNGFTLANQYMCRDINECVERPYVCTQLCENRPGTYACKCAQGYERNSLDSRLCKIIGERIEANLLFTNRYYLRNITLQTNNYNLIKDGFHDATGVAYDYNHSLLFVSDATGSIHRLKLNESTHTSFETIIEQLGDVGGVAVDWIGKKLYFVLRTLRVLMVSELNGHSRAVLLNSSVLQEPTSIVLDPFAGYVFFTDWRYPAYIGRMSMDGKSFKKIVTEDVGSPIGLTIDIITQRIWWSDTHLKKIEFSNYDGLNRYAPLYADSVVFPFDVAFYDGFIYWSDRGTDSIYSADALNGSNKTVIRQNTVHSVSQLIVYHYSLQPQGPSPCGLNHGCSHLCLIGAGGKNYSCTCPDYFVLGSDGKTCTANCSAYQFRCGVPDERCIPFYWKCGN
jgi:low density lipoprotein-related protein 2